MIRRSFLKSAAIGALGAGSTLFTPFVAGAAQAKVLRFVPQANLSSLDPILSLEYVVRNASLLIWETLYGVDSQLRPQPQMAEGHELSDDGKTWTFKLRSGLTFHDGQAVLSRDAVASLARWMVRDPLGQMIKAQLEGMEVIDDRSFRLRLSKPFPLMLFALGKAGTPMPFIMPERLAKTDPFKPISEPTGSGPMRFARNEWVPGSQAVFERFDGYQPRAEPADWLAGGRRMLLDRIEWHVIPDPATAAAALQSGEVDWWESPIPDLVPMLKGTRDLVVGVADPLGNIGAFRMNHLYPPFNDVHVRRAVQMVLNQADYMHAVVGDDDTLWKPLPSFFTPGTPYYTEFGGDVLKGPRRLEEARRLVAGSGYNGDPVVMLVGTDQAILKAQSDITADLLTKLGMKVDYVATDWGTVGARRAKKDPPAKGGWNLFHTTHAGMDCINPAAYKQLTTTGDTAYFGWPKSVEVQAEIDAWYAAATPEAGKAAMDRVNAASMDFVTEIPTGFFLTSQAWRASLSGIVKAPFPVYWGVTKS